MSGAALATGLDYHLLDVFTDRAGGGNPVAVFVDAPALPDETMQATAAALGLSETVFVLPATDGASLRRLRIFTPAMELPFAGHPTIGTAHLLVDLGAVNESAPGTWRFALEETVGRIAIEVTASGDGGRPRFAWLTTSALPTRGPEPPDAAALASVLGVDERAIVLDEKDAPRAYSAGVPFLYVPVRDRATLARVRIDVERWKTVVASFWAPHVYVFVPPGTDGLPDHELAARMFAPAMGIVEDPATGGAVAGLAGYLRDRGEGLGRWMVAQGREMGRASELHVELLGDGGSLEAVRVGGAAVRVGTRRFEGRTA